MDPNTVILFEDKPNTYRAPFHQMTPSKVIQQLHVGSRVTVFGQIRKYVEGSMVTEYIHLRGGAYTLDNPIQFLTFHGMTIQ